MLSQLSTLCETVTRVLAFTLSYIIKAVANVDAIAAYSYNIGIQADQATSGPVQKSSLFYILSNRPGERCRVD